MWQQLRFNGLAGSNAPSGAAERPGGRSLSPHTLRSYWQQYKFFFQWQMDQGGYPIPSSPDEIVRYLEFMSDHGYRISTMRSAIAAVRYFHQQAGHDDPIAASVVKTTLHDLKTADGRGITTAQPLTQAALFAIKESACTPREISGMVPRTEDPEVAHVRGLTDIALVSVMREAGLRRSEAAALRWGDIRQNQEGKTIVFIGGTQGMPIGTTCVRDLEAIRPPDAEPEQRVFDLSPGQIGRRIRAAAQGAGLGDGYTGQSCRVGLVQDLAKDGKTIRSVMEAGRWKSAGVPASYMKLARAEGEEG